MTERIGTEELLDGYPILFDANTRLAHEAVLLWAQENEPDGWPTPASVHRFAKCYGVPLDTLAGLCGILTVKRGNRHYYCDSRRHPDLVAPLRAGVWVRQRARWFKGFAVTAIVHARTPRQTLRELGAPGCIALLAQLPVSLLCTAAHPLGVGLALGGDLSGPLGWLLLLGYAAAVALHAAAAPRAGLPAWLALLLPFYWALHWAALLLALSDLVRDPAHWRKTDHGAAQRGNTLGVQAIWPQQVANTPAE